MDERTPPEAPSLPLQGPHWQRPLLAGETPGLTPLRLVLQPSGWSIDVNKPEVALGRHVSADLRLPLPDVSRRHCRLVFADGLWHVFDLNSLNGVHVNGEQVQYAMLHQGDELRIGGFTFTVEMAAGERTMPLPTNSDANKRRAS